MQTTTLSELSDHYVMVRVSTKTGLRERKHKAETASLLQRYGYEDTAARVVSTLFDQRDRKDLTAPTQEVVKAVREITLDWALEPGWRLIKVEDEPRLNDIVVRGQVKLYKVLRAKAYDWDNVLLRARNARNGLFVEEDYPSFGELADLISISYQKRPIIGTEFANHLQGIDAATQARWNWEVKREIAVAERGLREDVAARAAKAVADLIEKCETLKDRKPGQRVHDSVVGNVRAVLQVADSMSDVLGAKFREALIGLRVIATLKVEKLREAEPEELAKLQRSAQSAADRAMAAIDTEPEPEPDPEPVTVQEEVDEPRGIDPFAKFRK